MNRIATLLVAAGVGMSITAHHGVAQESLDWGSVNDVAGTDGVGALTGVDGCTNCAPCEDDIYIFGWRHRFPGGFGGGPAYKTCDGDGSHGTTWKDGTCFYWHDGRECLYEEEQEFLDVFVTSVADGNWSRASIALAALRRVARVDRESRTVTVRDCREEVEISVAVTEAILSEFDSLPQS